MNKLACVIGLATVNGKKVLLKNRDRNYIPTFKIYHIIDDNGTEIVYFQDTVSGWVEGMNEHGICITNSALAVIADEKEVKKSRPGDRDRYSRDSWRFLEALKCKSLLEALHVMTHHKKGVQGHTIITDGKNTFVVEQTSLHDPKVQEITDTTFVRTNHGIHHLEAGYVQGEDRESSEQRYQTAFNILDQKNRSPMEIIKKLYKKRIVDLHNPFNVMRKTDNMFTSNEIVYEPLSKRMTIVLVDEDSVYEGYEKHFTHKPKCKVCVKRVHLDDYGSVCLTDLDLNKLDVLRSEEKDTLKVFVYGSLMHDYPYPDEICSHTKSHINGHSRSFNLYSKNRKHLVLGTKPYGSMQGVLLEYPLSLSEKVLKKFDAQERQGYLRTPCIAFTKDAPQGSPAYTYITNEESDCYTGEYEFEELVDEFIENEDGIEYINLSNISLKSHNITDKCIEDLYGRIIEKKKELN